MSERHPDDATFVAWVSGALDATRTAAFEDHVIGLGCMPCAVRLEHHARLEVVMHEAAVEMPSTRRRLSSRPSVPGGASTRASMPAGLALAASLVLGLGLPGRWLSFDRVDEDSLASGAIVEATPWRELAPACPVQDDPSRERCDDPSHSRGDEGSFELEGALAMTTMPEPSADDGPNLCEDDLEGDGLVCGAGESMSG